MMIKLILIIRVSLAMLTLDLEERIATEMYNDYELTDRTYQKAERAAEREGIDVDRYIDRAVYRVELAISNQK